LIETCVEYSLIIYEEIINQLNKWEFYCDINFFEEKKDTASVLNVFI